MQAGFDAEPHREPETSPDVVEVVLGTHHHHALDCDFGAEVEGINDLKPQEAALAAKVTEQYGPEVGKLAYDET